MTDVVWLGIFLAICYTGARSAHRVPMYQIACRPSLMMLYVEV
jgi:hypothetical protein